MSEKEPITVAIIDHDKDFFEDSLVLLKKEADIEVCLSHLRLGPQNDPSKEEAVSNAIYQCQPKVLILSQMVVGEVAIKDLKVVLRIRDKVPDTRVVIIFDHFFEEAAMVAVREGARGLYLRDTGPSQIVSCVRAIARGEVWLEASLVGRMIGEFSRLYKHVESLRPPKETHEERLSLLSRREMEILEHVAKSYTNMDIGKKLFISEKTVKTHIKTIFEKLGVRNRVEATLIFIRSGVANKIENHRLLLGSVIKMNGWRIPLKKLKGLG